MKDLWNGRFDSDERIDLRIWQIVKPFENAKEETGVCFIGYDTDDGIKRNQGRIGAEKGPNAIRKAIQSFPIIENLKIYDYRNLKNKILEEAQKEYSIKIYNVIKKEIFPIGLGMI